MAASVSFPNGELHHESHPPHRQLQQDEADEFANLVQLQRARDDGLSIHDMPRDVTAVLADHGIFTTENSPRRPGSFHEFRQSMKTIRALGEIAGNVHTVLAGVPEFADASESGTSLGSRLVQTFGAVTSIEADDVHAIIDDHKPDGEIVLGDTKLTVSTAEEARMLCGALQGLLRRKSGVRPVCMDPGGNDRAPSVEVPGLSEHEIRSIGRAVGAVVAVEAAQHGVVLPAQKVQVARWEEQGETFPPELRKQLQTSGMLYRKLKKEATYRGDPELRPIDYESLIGTGTPHQYSRPYVIPPTVSFGKYGVAAIRTLNKILTKKLVRSWKKVLISGAIP